MTERGFDSELAYQASLSAAKGMLSGGAIGEAEYAEIAEFLKERHKPQIGGLLAETTCYPGRSERCI